MQRDAAEFVHALMLLWFSMHSTSGMLQRPYRIFHAVLGAFLVGEGLGYCGEAAASNVITAYVWQFH
jgi:hypothetical protein